MKTEQDKANADTGSRVRAHLIEKGVETPTVDVPMSQKEREQKLEHLFGQSMLLLGLDMSDDSLQDTPRRVARMWINELFWGLDYGNFPKATVIDNKMRYDEMVMERNVSVASFCEHHLLPITGFAHVAYIPSQKVLGLSKINRIVEFFSRRPQVQERLTAQVFNALCLILETEDVAVCIEAEHDCVKLRGVEDACSDTVTTQLGGVFRAFGGARTEFFSGIQRAKRD